MNKAILLSLAMMLSLSISAQDIRGFVNKQMEIYPKSRLLDIYKSCFQDYMGAEHLVSDKQTVQNYLDEELATVSLDELMPWYYEPCGIDGKYVRVNLRTVKENIITKEALLDAFIRSANSEKRPSVNSWREQWHRIIERIDAMSPNLLNYQEDKQYIDSILAIGKYAISHSPEYREAYHPHYRIVERNIFENEIKPLIQKTMIVRIAEIEVYPEYLNEYLDAARNVGAESVKLEPGVICIFPMQITESPNEIRIIEIYQSDAAYQSHLQTPHFLKYKQGTLHMVKSLKLVNQTPLDSNAMPTIFKKLTQ